MWSGFFYFLASVFFKETLKSTYGTLWVVKCLQNLLNMQVNLVSLPLYVLESNPVLCIIRYIELLAHRPYFVILGVGTLGILFIGIKTTIWSILHISKSVDEDTKWKTRILRQICTVHTADPVGKGRKSCLYTILEYSCTGATFCPYRLDQLYVFAQYPRLPFCGLIYTQLIHLWI